MRAGVAEKSDWLPRLGKNILYDWTYNSKMQQLACPTCAAGSVSVRACLFQNAAPENTCRLPACDFSLIKHRTLQKPLK
jgi:hypothetical protein